jgi:NADH-quinone oxidoreductase subunit N
VVSVFYYFRVIQAMYFRSADDQEMMPEFPKSFPILLLVTALLVVLLGIFPETLLGLLYF